MAYNYKGINTDGIKPTCDVLRHYVEDVERYLDSIKSPEVAAAFKGRYAGAIQDFINSSVEAVKRPLNELRDFEGELRAVGERYENKDTEIQSQIKSSSQQ